MRNSLVVVSGLLHVKFSDLVHCFSFYDFRIKRCLVGLNLQLFVGRLMSYLRHLCLLAYSGGVKHKYCVVFLL
jgi:hypothetical protein